MATKPKTGKQLYSMTSNYHENNFNFVKIIWTYTFSGTSMWRYSQCQLHLCRRHSLVEYVHQLPWELATWQFRPILFSRLRFVTRFVTDKNSMQTWMPQTVWGLLYSASTWRWRSHRGSDRRLSLPETWVALPSKQGQGYNEVVTISRSRSWWVMLKLKNQVQFTPIWTEDFTF